MRELLHLFQDRGVLAHWVETLLNLLVSALNVKLVAVVSRISHQDRHALPCTRELHSVLHIELHL